MRRIAPVKDRPFLTDRAAGGPHVVHDLGFVFGLNRGYRLEFDNDAVEDNQIRGVLFCLAIGPSKEKNRPGLPDDECRRRYLEATA